MRAAPFLLLLLLLLAGCASAPAHTGNACSIFKQRDGWFNNWYRETRSAERRYGVPVPVILATIYKESSFKARARPPRRKLLGFIPWTRPSSAYGYSQAIDGTWEQYRRETGRWGARRSDFGDAADFIGWYHRKSHDKNGIALNDTYNLYLAYYYGHSGYARGRRPDPAIRRAARDAAGIAQKYAAQLSGCGYR